MTRFAHVNGALVPTEDATVSVRDRGFLYGDAIFETLRAYGGDIFAWEEHWARLQRGCETIALDHGVPRSDAKARIDRTLEANELADAYVRLSISRGEQAGRLTPSADVDPTIVILVEPLPRGGIDGESVWDAPATCTVASIEHHSEAAMPAHLKSHNYLNGILATLEADGRGAEEALLLDGEGRLTEGTTTNVFFVADGTVQTPSLDVQPVLPGITRAIVLDLATNLDIPVETGTWMLPSLLKADEAFVTNSTWEIRPVTAVDDARYEVGPITTRLMRAFDERIESSCYVS